MYQSMWKKRQHIVREYKEHKKICEKQTNNVNHKKATLFIQYYKTNSARVYHC